MLSRGRVSEKAPSRNCLVNKGKLLLPQHVGFPTNQIPTIRFRALLNEEASEVELVLRVAGKEDKA